MNQFKTVTPTWIRERLKETGSTQKQLAAGVNVSESQVSKWISGARNPSGAAKAAIWYYFHKKRSLRPSK